jgi:hypothetical protein
MMKKIAVALVAVMIAGMAGLAQAGSDTGPGVYKEISPAYGSKTIPERYRGGEIAILELSGDGDTDLDIYVYDAAGNLVAFGVGVSDRERVTFTPTVTGNYRIEIRNLGGVFNRFQLRTN